MLEAPLNESKEETISLLDDFVIRLFHRGSVVILIEGRRNSGKTNMALKIMEICYNFHIIDLFANNEQMINPYFPIEHIDNLEDLESWSHNQRGKKLYILDEAGKAMPRRSPMNKLNIQLLQNFQTLRHSDLSLIIICPHEKYIDSASLGTDVLDLRIQKRYSFPDGNPNPKIALWYDLLTNRATTLTGIEETSLRYNDKWDCIFKKDSVSKIPKFKDEHLAKLYSYACGGLIKDIFRDRSEFHYISRKYLKESLEKERIK